MPFSIKFMGNNSRQLCYIRVITSAKGVGDRKTRQGINGAPGIGSVGVFASVVEVR